MISKLLGYTSVATLGVGGLGTGLFLTGALSSYPKYDKFWNSKDNPSGTDLVCGLSKDKWICNLWISLTAGGGGIHKPLSLQT